MRLEKSKAAHPRVAGALRGYCVRRPRMTNAEPASKANAEPAVPGSISGVVGGGVAIAVTATAIKIKIVPIRFCMQLPPRADRHRDHRHDQGYPPLAINAREMW
jgi:hypothetical protein